MSRNMKVNILSLFLGQFGVTDELDKRASFGVIILFL